MNARELLIGKALRYASVGAFLVGGVYVFTGRPGRGALLMLAGAAGIVVVALTRSEATE